MTLHRGDMVYRVVDGELRKAVLAHHWGDVWVYRKLRVLSFWPERGQHWWASPVEALARWVGVEIYGDVAEGMEMQKAARIVRTVLDAKRTRCDGHPDSWDAGRLARLLERLKEIGHPISWQAELARDLGVTRTTVNGWMKEKSKPSTRPVARRLEELEEEAGLV